MGHLKADKSARYTTQIFMTKILAIGAHPDDIEFGCAPLLIKEAQKGNTVKIVVCSLGEAGTSGTPASRKKESLAAAKLMHARIEFIVLGGDAHFEYKPQNSIKLAKIIRQTKADIVLAPSMKEEQHPDHRILAQLVRDACRLARYGGLKELKKLPQHKISALYYYQSSADFYKKPDIVIDVSDVEKEWVKVIKVHKSQTSTVNYPELVLTKARALGASIGVKYALGLWANDPIRLDFLSDITESSRNY
jgi:LmbE family N-acetylglucosaminyl deacetylase